VLEDCLRRRRTGEHLPDEAIIAGHPELMPELARELRKLRVIERALRDQSTVDHPRHGDRGPAATGAPPAIPNYDLLHPIGRGAFGEVWLGRNQHTGQFYAVKAVPRSWAVELEGIREYIKRARGHANLLPIEHVGDTGTFLYYTMPLADDATGPLEPVRAPQDYQALTLQRYLKSHAPLPVEEVLTIADQLLRALAHLHAADLLHKDVKPGNILRLQGIWCLGDMGLTTHCEQPQQGRGTPAFWPPEGPRDRTADLYALGKTLYLLLTGADLSRFRAFANGTLQLPSTDRKAVGLRRIICRACEDDPSRRFPNANAMRQNIVQLRGRKPGWLAVAAVGLLLACLGTYFATTWLKDGGAARPPLGLQLALSASKMGNDQRLFSLDEAGVLPLRAGDGLRIEVRTTRPTYFYVLNLDAAGRALPMYPWRRNDWDDVTEEKPRDFFCIPSVGDAAKLQAGPSGMEAVVVLARDTPLTASECRHLRSMLGVWPKNQGAFDSLRAAVSIGADKVRFADPHDHVARGAINPEDPIVLKDPVLCLQHLLEGDLRSLGVVSYGVCYTFQGD
jgi:hypothetical protein